MKTNTFEYTMTKEMARFYLKNRKGDEAKMRPQEYLCKMVNDEFHLQGTCIKVYQR